jgi:predicted GNAT family N-acyltransferase
VIEVRPASGPAEVDAALQLRYRVFCEEQGVTVAADQDGRDPEALHIVAWDADGRLAGACRVVFDGAVARLGRMAVEPELRGRGIGAAMLAEAERESRRAGAERIRLHAQTAARSLYERAGFEVRGEEFLEEGIPHVTMEKTLA